MLDDRRGEKSRAAQPVDLQERVAGSECVAPRVEQSAEMRITRRLVAERASDRDLARRSLELVVCAQHDVDPHRHVVDHRREVRRRGSAGRANHEVRDPGLIERDVALDQIVDDDRPGRNAKPHRALALVRSTAGK